MKRLFVAIIFIVLCSFTGPGDPPEVGISFNSFWRAKSVAIAGYTKINARYEWTAGAFDSGLHVPQYNGVPSGLRSGVWNADGAIAADTANSRLYLYSAGVWNLIGGAGTTPTLQQVLTAGSTLTSHNTIDADGHQLEIINVTNLTNEASATIDINAITASAQSSIGFTPVTIWIRPHLGNLIIDSLNYTLSTTGKKIMLRDTATGLVQNIDAALLGGVNIYNSDGTLTGNRTVDGDGNDLTFTNITNGEITAATHIGIQAGSTDFTGLDINPGYIQVLADRTGATTDMYTIPDSIQFRPHLGQLNIDSLRSATDTTTRKPMVWSPATGRWEYLTYWPGGGGDLTPYTRQQDTITLAYFGAGARFQADTAAFTDSTLYGAFYNDGSDSLIVSKIWAVMSGGTSDTLGVQLYYNDSLNVIGSAIATSTLPVNSTTVGNSTTTLSNQKIPPGNWVWCKSPTVVAGRKPYFLSVSMIGYKSRRL